MNFGITVLYDALRMKYYLLYYKTDGFQTNEQITALLCIGYVSFKYSILLCTTKV